MALLKNKVAIRHRFVTRPKVSVTHDSRPRVASDTHECSMRLSRSSVQAGSDGQHLSQPASVDAPATMLWPREDFQNSPRRLWRREI